MGTLKTYKSYVFKDKDPVIDEIRTLIQKVNNGKLTNKSLTFIEHEGGPTVSCLRGWFFGKTLRPQNPTVEAAGRALGFKRIWVKDKTRR